MDVLRPPLEKASLPMPMPGGVGEDRTRLSQGISFAKSSFMSVFCSM